MLEVVKSFIKDETYTEYKYPRLINSRVDLAKCLIGPAVAAISAKVFDLPWFIKKIPVCDRPMAIMDTLYGPGRTYEYTDYTSFEAHFTPEIMEVCQFELYKYMTKSLGQHKDIMAFCFGTLAGTNVCKFKHVTVHVKGVRMSGEMDTSLSNGFHNLVAYLFCVFENSQKFSTPKYNVRGFVEGDDGIFTLSDKQLTPTVEQFAALGLTIKIGSTTKLSEASFCGQVYDTDENIVVTDVVEALARVGWTNKKYVQANNKTLLQLTRAKGFSLAYQYNGCPVLGALGHKILDLTEDVKISEKIFANMDQWESQKLREAVANRPLKRTPVS